MIACEGSGPVSEVPFGQVTERDPCDMAILLAPKLSRNDARTPDMTR